LSNEITALREAARVQEERLKERITQYHELLEQTQALSALRAQNRELAERNAALSAQFVADVPRFEADFNAPQSEQAAVAEELDAARALHREMMLRCEQLLDALEPIAGAAAVRRRELGGQVRELELGAEAEADVPDRGLADLAAAVQRFRELWDNWTESSVSVNVIVTSPERPPPGLGRVEEEEEEEEEMPLHPVGEDEDE
jgi:hypothetical protein